MDNQDNPKSAERTCTELIRSAITSALSLQQSKQFCSWAEGWLAGDRSHAAAIEAEEAAYVACGKIITGVLREHLSWEETAAERALAAAEWAARAAWNEILAVEAAQEARAARARAKEPEESEDNKAVARVAWIEASTWAIEWTERAKHWARRSVKAAAQSAEAAARAAGANQISCIIEARDSRHAWDSDYVGNDTYTLSEARAVVAGLRQRAKTDPPQSEDTDEDSWRGWEFRIRAENENGCYCLDVE